MRLCFPVSSTESDVNIMAMTGDFEDNVKYLAGLGYDGIELMIRSPSIYLVEFVAQIMERYHMEIAAVGVTPIVLYDKLYISSPSNLIRDKALETAYKVIDFASALSAPFCIGSFRGKISNDSGNELDDARIAFKNINNYAKCKSVKVLVEPQGKSNSNYMNTFAEAEEFKAIGGCDNLEFIFDMFHADKNELNMFETLKAMSKYISFIHSSDRNRAQLGQDTMPIDKIFAVLKTVNYSGWVSTEIKQYPDSKTAARLSYEYLDRMRKTT